MISYLYVKLTLTNVNKYMTIVIYDKRIPLGNIDNSNKSASPVTGAKRNGPRYRRKVGNGVS